LYVNETLNNSKAKRADGTKQMADPVRQSLEQQQQMIQAWLHAPVPRFYANGIAVASTASDIAIVFTMNGAPSSILNLSFGTAKSLTEELTRTLADLEKATGQEIKTINQVSEDLNKVRSGFDMTSKK
jgi:pyruvate/oxaloacetate carboxyltransferase